jgi:hypothetical protein
MTWKRFWWGGLAPDGLARILPSECLDSDTFIQLKGHRIMRRLLSFSVLALIGLSACESESMDSPLAPEVPQALFAKKELPVLQPTTECPPESCILDPATLTRETGAPTIWIDEFFAEEDQEAEFVLVSSNPKTTTVKVWLNGKVIARPSAMARARDGEVRVAVTLAEENELKIRMAAKPGTQISFWLEGEAGDPSEPLLPPPPEPTLVFQATAGAYPMTVDLNVACEGEFPGFTAADWTDLQAADAAGTLKILGLEAGYAFVLNGGIRTSGSVGFPPTTYYYALSSIGPYLGENYGTVGGVYDLTGVDTDQKVLCMGTPPSP